jgi:hypothetical protein
MIGLILRITNRYRRNNEPTVCILTTQNGFAIVTQNNDFIVVNCSN